MNLLFVNYLCFFMQKQRNLFVLAAKQGGTRDIGSLFRAGELVNMIPSS